VVLEVDPADERCHAPGDEPLWNESWYFDFTSSDGRLGGYVRIGLYPNLGRVWYWACVVGEGRALVTVIDHEVPLPRSPRSLELRSSGLWADHHCEQVLERWSLGLEAFGVSLADPTETYGRMRGDQVPLGFDLEWETAGRPYRWPAVVQRYEIPCAVHGEILCGQERIDFEGVGQRDHSWGVRDWWVLGWCWFAGRLTDGTAFHASKPEGLDWAAGYVQRDGELDEIEACDVRASLGPAGLPESIALGIGGLELAVAPVAWSPVLLTADDGRVSRFPRALVRFRELSPESRNGVGWIEFNQPTP
jgi:hypothetical protein